MSDSQRKPHEHIPECSEASCSAQQSEGQRANNGTEAQADAACPNSLRNDALAAAEKGLEAARAALAAAERKLAEAQREAACRRAEKDDSSDAMPIEPSEASSQRSESCQKKTSCNPAPDPSASMGAATAVEHPTGDEAVSYAAPQGAPRTPASAPYRYPQDGSSAQAPYQDPYAAQGAASGAYHRMPTGQADTAQAFSQAGARSDAQPQEYQSYGFSGANQAYARYDAAYQQRTVPRQPPIQPHYAPPLASRDHVAAGLLAIFLGAFGVHKFYMGYNTQGFIMLALGLIGGVLSFGLVLGVVWIIAIIEGIIYLVKSQSEFERIYIYGKREWF